MRVDRYGIRGSKKCSRTKQLLTILLDPDLPPAIASSLTYHSLSIHSPLKPQTTSFKRNLKVQSKLHNNL